MAWGSRVAVAPPLDLHRRRRRQWWPYRIRAPLLEADRERRRGPGWGPTAVAVGGGYCTRDLAGDGRRRQSLRWRRRVGDRSSGPHPRSGLPPVSRAVPVAPPRAPGRAHLELRWRGRQGRAPLTVSTSAPPAASTSMEEGRTGFVPLLSSTPPAQICELELASAPPPRLRESDG
ncbi:unnamed protein product [Urochloa humidicola]